MRMRRKGETEGRKESVGSLLSDHRAGLTDTWDFVIFLFISLFLWAAFAGMIVFFVEFSTDVLPDSISVSNTGMQGLNWSVLMFGSLPVILFLGFAWGLINKGIMKGSGGGFE
jgi:hypothetical protein